MKKTISIFLTGLILILSSCSINNIGKFEKVVSDAEQNGKSYTKEDWEKSDDFYEDFQERYTYEKLKTLSEEEQKKVGQLMARYIKARLVNCLNETNTAINTCTNILNGFMEEIESDSSDLKQIIGSLNKFDIDDDCIDILNDIFEDD